jgi:hypothetical protein
VPDILTSLETPTMLRVNGQSPVMFMIEQLSATECRMRSVNELPAGASVEFTVTAHGLSPLVLSGNVRSHTQNGLRHVYGIALATTPAQSAAITQINDVLRARSAAAPDVPTNNGLTRASIRIAVDFELQYSVGSNPPRTARATNISIGGILMNTPDTLAVGTSLELDVPLDNDQRLPFNGRIVAHQEASPNYNIAFFDVKSEARERLARFIESRAK